MVQNPELGGHMYETGHSLKWDDTTKAMVRDLEARSEQLADWFRGVLDGQAERIGPGVRRLAAPGDLLQITEGKGKR